MLARRTRRFFAASMTLICSQTTFAIGVGEIVVKSYVNEPLSAEIAVLDPKGLSDSEVIASLASLADFERLGVERHYGLGALVFSTDMKGGESSTIRVTTDTPIREPYLNFLVELKWPEGRVLREYTVFLDLRPRPRVDSAEQSVDTGAPSAFSNRLNPGEYRVAPNDTLGAIAARFKSDGVSIDQMMLAIKDANPGKFLRDNINGIRAGALLEIPSSIDTLLSPRDAAQKVVDEWSEWKGPAVSRGLRIVADNEIEIFEGLEAESDLSSEPSPVGGSVDTAAIAPVSADSDSSPNLTGNSERDLAAIEARLSALSGQLREIQDVLASKDEEIAALKAELAKRPVASVAESAPAPKTTSDQIGSGSSSNGTLWASLIAALAALAYIALRRLSGSVEGDTGNDTSSKASGFETVFDELLPVPSQSEQMGQPSESEASKGYGESLLTSYAADQSLADAIAEADIYVAYGRHQHALDTLEAASVAEPSNASGLLKMLDIYISLDRVEEGQRLLSMIEQTGDRGSLSMAEATLSSASDALEGDAAAKALATESVAIESEEPDEIDVSLDLEFQKAANSERAVLEESDSSGMLDSDEDPAETALDLARVYLDMGDKAGAKDLLQTAMSMGDEAQVEVAKQLLASIE